MMIIIGTVLTQPQLYGHILAFQIRAGCRTFTVIRTDPKDQKLDILFLCVGQRIVLCAHQHDQHLITAKIRIFSSSERNYIEDKQNGVLLCGDSAITGADSGDSEI